jgi:hypothetical protein
MLIEYLTPVVNNFSNQPNIILESSKFTYFNDIFDVNFYRYGIVSNNNASLQNSIMYCLDVKNVDLKLNLLELSNSININIIIFDFTNGKIYSTYYGDFFNPWRPTIFLANYKDWWEPIVTKDVKIFSFAVKSNNIINIFKNKILSKNIFKYLTDIKITINDNFMEILEMEKLLNNKSIKHDSSLITDLSHNDTFINSNNFSKTKLEKMKKDELLQILINMNLNIKLTKKLTKKDYISLICKEEN